MAGSPSTLYIRYLGVADGSWKFSGIFEAHTWNQPPRHEVSVDAVTGKRYLRVASQGAQGSGADEQLENWFDLTEEAFAPILTVPVTAHHDPAGNGVGRALHAYSAVDGDFIRVTFELHFQIDGEEVAVREYRAMYPIGTPPNARRVGPVSVDPAMTSKAFQSLIDFEDGPGEDALLRIVLPELRMIAAGNESIAKTALRGYLSRSRSPLPAVRELRVSLSKGVRSR